MVDEILYMSGVVAAGFAVNFLLRALPFIIFAGRNRELPVWVKKLGRYISPVIIAGLIVYSYSGLAWTTLWPYLAGALTVALQLGLRNPLVSIIGGTVLYMILISCCGCAAQRIELDSENPDFVYSSAGVRFGERFVTPEEVPQILRDYEIPKDRTIHILLEPGTVDLKPARRLLYTIRLSGYTNVILVTKRHSESVVTGKRKNTAPPGRMWSVDTGEDEKPKPAAPKTIRYKKASE